MNPYLIVALVVVVAIFIFVSMKKKKEQQDVEPKFKPFSQRRFSADVMEFLTHLAKMLVCLAILIGWLVYWIFDVLREFVRWMRSKNEKKEKKIPDTHR
jgi:flagellar biosynthesis protein FliQ